MNDILEALSLDPANDVVRLVALALPVFVLLLLIAIWVRARARRRAARQNGAVQDGSRDASLNVLQAVSGAQIRSGRESAVESPPHVDPRVRVEMLKADLKSAMLSQSNTALAPIYLELARQFFAAGDEKSYLDALRSAAGIASQHGPRAVHAEVRLELAEAALRAGDTIGACEHWQMARIAFEEDGQRDAFDRVDQRMRDNGCPTDWVLTDF